MKQGTFLMLVALCFVCHTGIYAYDDTPSCFKDLETTFFDPNIVNQALVINQGYVDYQNRWVPINSELKRRSLEVPTILKQRADRMSPSPLEYPFQPEIAADLLWKILFEIFVSVMNQNAIYNQGVLVDMFEYIRNQQEPRIRACLGPAPQIRR